MKTKSLAIRTAWMFILSCVTVTCAVSQSKRVEIPKQIVEQIINHPKIETFLHPEAPGRIPLVISAHLINPRLSLRKFGNPVRIVKTQDLNAAPCLEFVDFEAIKNVVKVNFRYRFEGVAGTFTFSRLKNSRWKLLKAEVWEH